MKSIIKEVSKTAKIVFFIRRLSRKIYPAKSIGMLIRMVVTPIGSLVRKFIIMLIPETPPGAMFAGSRKHAIPPPYKKAPVIFLM